ncbi:hypothetical protein [Nocardia asteroides]|uniref:hypothetical protein n=1 Tax=Nocardia asteroides TaxID=1824 RepID=UPI0034131C70
MFGDQLLHAGAHLGAVAPDVAQESPGDAVVEAVTVLTALVAPAALQNAGGAGDGGQVEEYDGVGRGESDRQGARS